jgi:uncharacterized protein GlcG (DUF336 family)
MSSPGTAVLTAAKTTAVLASAQQAATSRGVACSVSVVDRSGHLLGFTRMDGAALAGIELSLSKARTSILVGGYSTAALAEQLAAEPALIVGLAVGGSLAIVPGVEPIHHDGTLVGAIGVSGVAADSDVAIAVEAAAASGKHHGAPAVLSAPAEGGQP